MNTNFISFFFLTLSFNSFIVKATNHTVCFNYFMQKDKCVNSAAADHLRCKTNPQGHNAPVKTFALKSTSTQSPNRLNRRYDDPNSSFQIASGDGICKTYDTDKEVGVCLWSGAEQNNPSVESAGWLNGEKTSNCNKRVYIQRTGNPSSVQYAPVIDGCYFDATTPDVGCFEISVTKALFNLLKPTEEEKAAQHILNGITWDFDNTNGQSTQQGPV